jgi:preprotein translocase subunit SecD
VRIEENRTVGPSLGQDSVRQGLTAGLIGSVLVVLFMLLYYRLSGTVATVALILNVLLLLAGLGYFHATLTLPGIAGIVLTLGMAVDANVLIFERIREELRIGKPARAAIDAGFARAWSAILDGNVTTLIAAMMLFQFGTGPIKGFAVTLSLGLIANLFTAVFVCKVIFDTALALRPIQRLSI